MNKKGFAISVILYSVIFLIITIILIILGIVRTRYTVSESLKDEVMNEIENAIFMQYNTSNYACEITASSSDYAADLVLSVTILDGNLDKVVSYSWDGVNYTSSNSISVDKTGLFTAYFQDNTKRIGSCSASVIKKTIYRSRECSPSNLTFGSWYMESEGCDNSCEEITKASAESTYTKAYRTCTTRSDICSSPYYYRRSYSRNITGCNWNNETSSWSNWTDQRISLSPTSQVETDDSYMMVS